MALSLESGTAVGLASSVELILGPARFALGAGFFSDAAASSAAKSTQWPSGTGGGACDLVEQSGEEPFGQHELRQNGQLHLFSEPRASAV